MTQSLHHLLDYLDRYLNAASFSDYCPNGLQVEGRAEVARLVTGVTASQALINEAIAWEADAILVHHGFFWKGEDERVVGMKKRRLAALLGADVSLFAYHLPLDAHPIVGNNACLGRLLGLPETAAVEPLGEGMVGSVATLDEPRLARDLVSRLHEITSRQPLHIGAPDAEVERVAWCTGAAQGYIEHAVAAGADMYISGEVSEQTVHIAREEGIQFVAAGHHATELYGVQALGEQLAEHFGISHRFIDIANPV